jgi:hypothetical protein
MSEIDRDLFRPTIRHTLFCCVSDLLLASRLKIRSDPLNFAHKVYVRVSCNYFF